MFWKRSKGGEEPEALVREISEQADLDAAVEAGPVLLYKHSYRCGFCFRSLKEVQKFAGARQDVTVLQIDVVASRPLSDLIADRYGIRHESPQAIAVVNGEALWSASHLEVTVAAIGGGFGIDRR